MPRWKSVLERFNEGYKVDESTGCWICNATSRYPAMRVGKESIPRHRIAYELFVGPVPDGLCVLHKCDNPRCINPDHLFIGTQKDNMEDMRMKGRQRHGSGNRGNCNRGSNRDVKKGIGIEGIEKKFNEQASISLTIRLNDNCKIPLTTLMKYYNTNNVSKLVSDLIVRDFMDKVGAGEID